MRKAVLLVTLLGLVLAGCSGDPADDADDADGPAASSMPTLEEALDAFDAGNATSNLHRLGQFDVGGSEIDRCGDFLYTDSGDHVDVVDVSDPAAMTVVGTYQSPVDIQDLKVSHDCRWMFIGNDEEGSIPPVHDAGLPSAAPAGDGGIYVVDLADPTKPSLVSSLGVGPRRGPHMVYYLNTSDGRELVFGANADISINEFDRTTGTLSELSRYQADLVFAFNRDPQVIDALYQGWAHDMVAMEEDGKVLLYVANWDAGLRIVDVTDPAAPVEVGGWNDFPEGHVGNLHTVAADWVDGHRIVVGAVEVGFAVVGGVGYATHTEPAVMYVWDATEAASIKLLGTWQNPDGLPADRGEIEGQETSTHNLQFEGGRIYLAHYAKGVYVLDASTPDAWDSPVLLAYHKEPSDTVWDVVLNNGILYSSGSAGIVALHYPPDVVGELGIDSRA